METPHPWEQLLAWDVPGEGTRLVPCHTGCPQPGQPSPGCGCQDSARAEEEEEGEAGARGWAGTLRCACVDLPLTVMSTAALGDAEQNAQNSSAPGALELHGKDFVQLGAEGRLGPLQPPGGALPAVPWHQCPRSSGMCLSHGEGQDRALQGCATGLDPPASGSPGIPHERV